MPRGRGCVALMDRLTGAPTDAPDARGRLRGEATLPLRPGRAGLGELLITNDYIPRRISYH